MTPERTALHLAAAMPALRLNRAFLPWRTVHAHLRALAVACPDRPLTLTPGTAWPAATDWVRVRVDHGLAAGVLQSLPSGGGRVVALQRTYLTALLDHTPLAPSSRTVELVEALPGRLRVEIIHDARDLALPRLARTTARLDVPEDGAVTLSDGQLTLSDDLAEAIARLAGAPAAGTAHLATFGTVESVTVGAIGPARSGLTGPWLSAVLTRVSPELSSSRVDDPLRDDIVVPSPDRPERMSHIRKWAVPAADQRAARAWLAEQGSRNLVYPYRSPPS